MKKKLFCCLVGLTGTILLSATDGFSFGSFGTDVNTICAPTTPYTGSCNLCHVSDRGASTPAKTAYLAGGSTLTNFFCPPVQTCTDKDRDGYAIEGGNCGPVDCNDNNAAIRPGATENCSDKIDNNCNGLVDSQDPAAVACLVCTDSDGDGFAAEGGACGPVDCNDTRASVNPSRTDIPNNGVDEDCSGADTVDPTILDKDGDSYTPANGDCDDTKAAINPGATDIPNNGIDENCDGADSVDTGALDNDGDGFTAATGDCDDTDGAIHPNAVEICTDSVDNDCNGLVDLQDPNATNCPLTCTDLDSDSYAIEGGNCGPVDCSDNDGSINPGAVEICGDAIDNNCDGQTDEGCDVTCADADGDGYPDASCGGTDCNDSDAAINPGAAEVCGNTLDENCNGASDNTCLSCPDGTLLVIREMEYDSGNGTLHIKGRATNGTTITVINADTGKILKEGIRVRKGRWEAEIRRVGSSLMNISVLTSNGCAIDQAVQDTGGDDDRESDRSRVSRRTSRD